MVAQSFIFLHSSTEYEILKKLIKNRNMSGNTSDAHKTCFYVSNCRATPRSTSPTNRPARSGPCFCWNRRPTRGCSRAPVISSTGRRPTGSTRRSSPRTRSLCLIVTRARRRDDGASGCDAAARRQSRCSSLTFREGTMRLGRPRWWRGSCPTVVRKTNATNTPPS